MEIIFTRHAEYRLEKRKILRDEAIDAIKYPDKTLKKHGLYYFQKRLNSGVIEIPCEKKGGYIKIITIYWL